MIFWQLLKIDLLLFKDSIKDNMINTTLWAGIVCIVAAYFMTPYGLSKDYGVFQATSLIVNIAMFEIYSQMFLTLGDLEGERHISYHMTLPISNSLYFIKMAVMQTIKGLTLMLICIPVMKIILWNQFNLWPMLNPLFFLTLILVSAGYAFASLLLIGYTKATYQIVNVIMRIIFPLWFLGGFGFSFNAAYSVSPAFGTAILISPFIYGTEAIRNILLSKSEYLPLYISLTVLLAFALYCGYFGIKRLKKKLDCV